jgi:hypothetical protein
MISFDAFRKDVGTFSVLSIFADKIFPMEICVEN